MLSAYLEPRLGICTRVIYIYLSVTLESYRPAGGERRPVIQPFDVSRLYCRSSFSISRYFTECRIFRRRLLRGPAGGHHRLCALHPLNAASGRLFGDVGPTVASMGEIHQHDALRLSEYADSGIRRWWTDRVRPPYIFCHVGLPISRPKSKFYPERTKRLLEMKSIKDSLSNGQ